MSGRVVKTILGSCRQDRLARTWASELVKMYDKSTPPIAGDPSVRSPERESIDADQIRKAGARLTSGERRQYPRILAGCMSTRQGAVNQGSADRDDGMCSCGLCNDAQWHRLWGIGRNQGLRDDTAVDPTIISDQLEEHWPEPLFRGGSKVYADVCLFR